MKKLFTALLCTALLLSCLSACNEGTQTETEATTVAPETEAPLPDFDYSSEEVTIIRKENAPETIVTAMQSIRTAIKETYGTALTMKDDWLKDGESAGELEILIGNTNREESQTVLSELKNGRWTVKMQNGKLVIIGTTDELTVKAAEYFVSTLVPQGKVLAGDFAYEDGETAAISSLRLSGTDIRDCTIVYEKASCKTYATTLADYIADNAGTSVSVAMKATGEHNIIISTSYDGKNYSYDDYSVNIKDGSIYLTGGSSWTVNTAVYAFIDSFLSAGGDVAIDVSTNRTVLEYSCPDRSEYIKNPELFSPNWKYQWEPAAHMLDYQEKLDALTQDNTTHLFTISHRGDFLFYPENSIESYLSVWAMGGDCLEIDIHYTKDGVPVVMHDATLTRMTDYASYAGKNGYPNSANICDWTLEQLSVLRLKEGQGGSSAALTPYKIPTLEECLIAAKGRFFYIFDKASEWQYCDIDGLQPLSAKKYVYDIMKKTGNFESVLISYGTLDTSAEGTLDADEALKIQKYVYEHDGAKMYLFLRCWTGRSTVTPYAKTLTESSLSNSGLLVNGAFDPNNKTVISAVKVLRKSYPKAMIGGWTIDSNGYDCADTWEIMYKAGYRAIMTNNMYALVQFAATK